MKSENINALDEINKGACMGMDALHSVIEKVEDENFKNFLDDEYNQYEKICKDIEEIYPKYNDDKPHETNAITKAMTSMSIDMKTLTDHSNSKIAELLLQGVNMGIIEGRRILNKKKIDKEVENILSTYVKMQEDCVEVLKTYL